MNATKKEDKSQRILQSFGRADDKSCEVKAEIASLTGGPSLNHHVDVSWDLPDART
jgi:hypothetical protein